ncbi:hypothetical protein NL108_012268 [Boleophthalmus pectinirostris]|uniref:uncharacterized protein LOC110155987 n=1 Tax=Boleophthalmus pectinirostris TaxID=150288 RepID=UPI00242F6820|nr:uncharacterized protein LOC110155987 [Boleophthalmus pectinirostris]KAJ0051078.1 hypothetical protein NL108_012268 [Boleophthalmus pectinirostris]
MMASLAVTLFILLQAISTLAANEITSPSPSNITNSTLDTLQESNSNTNDITTSKAPSQDISSNLLSKNESSTTFRSVDDVTLTTVSPIQVDDEDISTTSNITGTMHNITDITRYGTTSNNKIKQQTMANESLIHINVTKTCPTLIEDNKNFTSSCSEAKTTSNNQENNTKNDSEISKNKDKKTKPAPWILPTLLSIVALCLIALFIHAKWEDWGKNQPRRSIKDEVLNGICSFRDCLWAQICFSGLERQQPDEELGDTTDAEEIGVEDKRENGIESGFGGREVGEICNGADKQEGGCNVTFEETKL